MAQILKFIILITLFYASHIGAEASLPALPQPSQSQNSDNNQTSFFEKIKNWILDLKNNKFNKATNVNSKPVQKLDKPTNEAIESKDNINITTDVKESNPNLDVSTQKTIEDKEAIAPEGNKDFELPTLPSSKTEPEQIIDKDFDLDKFSENPNKAPENDNLLNESPNANSSITNPVPNDSTLEIPKNTDQPIIKTNDSDKAKDSSNKIPENTDLLEPKSINNNSNLPNIDGKTEGENTNDHTDKNNSVPSDIKPSKPEITLPNISTNNNTANSNDLVNQAPKIEQPTTESKKNSEDATSIIPEYKSQDSKSIILTNSPKYNIDIQSLLNQNLAEVSPILDILKEAIQPALKQSIIFNRKSFQGTIIPKPTKNLKMTPIKKGVKHNLENKRTIKDKSQEIIDKKENIELNDKFIEDSIIFLRMPDDDVILGKIQEDARYDLIDFNSYVRLFWKNFNSTHPSLKKQRIDHFIHNYKDKFYGAGIIPYIDLENFSNSANDAPLTESDLRKEVINAVITGDIDSLQVWIDNYPLLNILDEEGNSLLAIAVEHDQKAIARYLLEKGIEYTSKNIYNETALEIAIKNNNRHLIKLLNDATKDNRQKIK